MEFTIIINLIYNLIQGQISLARGVIENPARRAQCC